LTIEGQEDFWRECAYVVLATKELTLLDVGIECSSTATADEFGSQRAVHPSATNV